MKTRTTNALRVAILTILFFAVTSTSLGMYDPAMQRFTSRDPVQGDYDDPLSLHKYLYTQNEPINQTDLSGESAIQIANGLKVATEIYAVGITVAAIGAANENLDLIDFGSIIAEIAAPVGFAIGYMSTPCVCFTADTEILTTSGEVPIEQIIVGDSVWAIDPESGEPRLFEVVNCFQNEADKLVVISIGDEEVRATYEHPFYVYKKGWVSASKLKAGDKLVNITNEPIVIDEVKFVEGKVKIYNFEAAQSHTYYVSSKNLLVHNKCKPKFKSTDALRRHNKQFAEVAKKLNLTKDQARQLHDEISGMGYGMDEIFEIAKTMFGK